MTSTVSIGEFVADVDSTSRYGVTANLTGWTDGAPVSDGISDRQQQDGGWDGTGFLRPRVITLDGVMAAVSHAEAMAVADTLTGLSPQGQYLLAVTDSAVGTRAALVRLAGASSVTWLNDTAFRYSVQMKAADPLKYGQDQFGDTNLQPVAGTGWVWPAVFPVNWGVPPGTTPGAVTVANAGTAAYWPRLRIDGPVTNPVVQLVETGDWVRFNGALTAGQWLDIVLADRRVLLNGQISQRQKVTSSGDWLAVPPGGGSVAWTADDADPAATLSVWSYSGAWI